MIRKALLTAGLSIVAAAALASSAAAKPGDVLVGTDGGGDDSLVRIDPRTGAVKDVADVTSGLAGMDFGADGSIFIANYFDAAIYKVNPRTGAFALFSDNTLFSNPYDIDRGPDGLMYVANDDSTGLSRFNPKTRKLKALANGADFDNLTDLAIRPSDETVFATSDDGVVVSYNIRTRAKQVVSSSALLGASNGITITPDWKLYVNNGDTAGAVFQLHPKSGAVTPVASGGLLGSTCAYELGTDFGGNILSATLCEDRVVRVDPRTGAQTLVAQGTGMGPDDFLTPEGIAVEPPRCGGRLATIVGTTGKDVLRGSRFGDVIAALGGSDKVTGAGGGDVVCGGGGRDRLTGGKGRDRLNGQAGRDNCAGGPAPDKLKSC